MFRRSLGNRKPLLFMLLFLVTLSLNLACSVGSLIVQVPTTPTLAPIKTQQATYTATPPWTPTFTPSATPTPTNTATPTATHTPTTTPTATPLPTDTPVTNKQADKPAKAAAPAPTAAPTDTPAPTAPTATATPAYPFNVVFSVHDTGSPGETRLTAWIRIDYEPGFFKTLSGFQMKIIAPDGKEYLSEMSGPGTADSTMQGTGDNHPMNTKAEIHPYTGGAYKVWLVENGTQVSPMVDINLSNGPLQYIHFDFFKHGQK